jgi:ryanodine receptor 2
MAEGKRRDEYRPQPIDTSGIAIPGFLAALSEALSKNAHEVWAAQRLHAGWHFGATRSDAEKLHPCLIPYEELPDEEKVYDRRMVAETIRSILALGYEILPMASGDTRNP